MSPTTIRTPHPRFGRTAGRSAWPGRAVESVERPRQAPVPALRRRPDAPLAPAHDRRLARPSAGRALAPRPATRLARPHPRRPGGRAVRRPGPRAADRDAPPLRPAPRARSAPTSSRRTSTRTRSCAGCARTTRRAAIGDALLDQRIVAGIGNLWKAEGCWLAEIDPWRATATVSDDEVLRIVRELRPRMQESARDGNQSAPPQDLRQRRSRLPALRRARSPLVDKATTTGRHTGAPDARNDLDPAARRAAHRPQGRRPHRARQHARRASTPRSPTAATWSSSTSCPSAAPTTSTPAASSSPTTSRTRRDARR